MTPQCPNVTSSLVNDSSVLKVTCSRCGSLIARGKDPKALAIAALAHRCKATDARLMKRIVLPEAGRPTSLLE
jgi:ribosomal protein S27E